jgi:hypothetical protein
MKQRVAIGSLFAVLILVVVVRTLPRLAQHGEESHEHLGLLGEWTLVSARDARNGVPTSANLPTRTRLGFGSGGREVIVAWLTRPHHKRPMPISQVGTYRLQGKTLIQIVPSSRDAFPGLGLTVSRSSAGTSLTSRFEVQGNRLILSQPETGKSVEFQLTANALPPTGPAGGLPAGH